MALPEFSKMTQDKTAVPYWAKYLKEGEFISYSVTYKCKQYFDLFDEYIYPCKETGDIKYYLYDPIKQGYPKDKKYPVVMFFHGASNALDGVNCIICCGAEQYASPKYQKEMGGAYIIVPVANEKRLENGVIDGTWSDDAIPYHIPVKGIYDKVISEHSENIKAKIILGASSGGKFTWRMLENYPDFFDGAIPIASGYMPDDKSLDQIGNTKTKVIIAHGRHDEMAEFDKCVEPHLKKLKTLKNCELFFPDWVYNGDGGIASVFYGFEMGQHCMINWIQANLMFDDGRPADERFPGGITGWIKNLYFTGKEQHKMLRENQYRTHTTEMITEDCLNTTVRVAGWVENIRDHGGIKFIDLRDHYGVVQVTMQQNEHLLDGIHREYTVSIEGEVINRDPSTYNDKIKTGKVEIVARKLTVLGAVTELMPFEVASSKESGEDIRLKYRFLDLRNRKMHDNIVFRSALMQFMREKMLEQGFLELQTPILSTSSPEGARDFLIPSRKHHGKFYALPQAPQIFKQLYMVSGFDKYFQLAPCFRDEDARADRTAGEFYQLDFEMAFATQEDVFAVAENLFPAILEKFGGGKRFSPAPFKRITYADAMLKYGTDKPDLRNPLEIIDISDLFVNTDFKPFRGKTVRAINVPGMASKSKSFFERMEDYALSIGMKGLGYIKVDSEMNYLGPIDKFLSDSDREALKERAALKPGDVLYFIADNKKNAAKFAGQIRTEVAERMELIDSDRYETCWIVDFPMFEDDPETGKPAFTHNPFSMPQGELEALNTKAPSDVLAYQFDLVCNGLELVSGAVRNHRTDVMIKSFEIAGYSEQDILNKFGSLYNAFKYGAPPHAGMAFGIDRMIMMLLDEDSIREVIAFPLNSNAQDLLLGAPTEVTEQQLREIHIRVRNKPSVVERRTPEEDS